LPGVILSLLGASASAQTVLHVDGDVTQNGDGMSWASPLRHLQDALMLAGSNPAVREVHIAAGIYQPDRSAMTPDGSGDRQMSFVVPSGVMVMGGFAGSGAPDPELRDIVVNTTTLSGDLLSNDGPNWANHGENSHHIVTITGGDATTGLDGLSISGGYAPSSMWPDGIGAGLLVLNGSPVLINCAITGNLATAGAGAMIVAGYPVFTSCTFSGNYAWGGRGGAIYGESGSDLDAIDCSFLFNTAHGAGGVGDGGAVFLMFDCPAAFTRCTFANNVAFTSSQIYPTGGAMSILADDVTLHSCGFYGNNALVGGPGGAGGAIWNGGDGLSLLNCVFSGNKAAAGGAVVCFLSSPHFVNCTIVANSADDGGGLFNIYNSHPVVTNCVLWDNTAVGTTLYKAQIHNATDDSSVDLSYSCAHGLFTPEPGEDPPDPADFPGCIDDDPLLADLNGADNLIGTTDDEPRLSAGSPGIDAGNNTAVPVRLTTDIAGDPRFIDDPDTRDTGAGSPPVVDMGAYEFGEPAVIGDLNGDGIVGPADLAQLLASWGACANCPADFNGDGAVGPADLAQLLAHWG
jgi:predicted outer membrane repeat protein